MYNARQERKGVIVFFHHIFGTFNMGCSEGLGASDFSLNNSDNIITLILYSIILG